MNGADLVGLVVGVIWTGFGALAVWGIVSLIKTEVSETRRSRRVADWSTTKGRVKTSEVRHLTVRTSRPYVFYSYQVEGRDYACDRIAFGSQFGKGTHHDVVAAYPAESEVDVHYDPADPGNAVLVKRRYHGYWPVAVLAGVLLPAVLVIAASGLGATIEALRRLF